MAISRVSPSYLVLLEGFGVPGRFFNDHQLRFVTLIWHFQCTEEDGNYDGNGDKTEMYHKFFDVLHWSNIWHLIYKHDWRLNKYE